MLYEKVSPAHPDKIADRIAGAIVDLAYSLSENPQVACEVMIGHGDCFIINETSQPLAEKDVLAIVRRISKNDNIILHYKEVPQDSILAMNQTHEIRCADNGIFKGVPLSDEERILPQLVKNLYNTYPTDGKYILDGNLFIICQSHMTAEHAETLKNYFETQNNYRVIINPLGEWTGGLDVDTGAVNRKLGSDMGQSITGGGLHGKDLSKGDITLNIYTFLKAQELGCTVVTSCAIGDAYVDDKPYSEIVEIARNYIKEKGGFEKFAEYGLV